MPPSPTRTSLKVGILVFSFMMSRYSLECRVQRWRWSRGLDGLVTEGALDDGMGVVRERERLKKIGIFGISCRSFSGAIRNQPLTIYGDAERRTSSSTSTARTVTASGLPMFFVFADCRGLILVGLFASTVEFVHHGRYLSLKAEILM